MCVGGGGGGGGGGAITCQTRFLGYRSNARANPIRQEKFSPSLPVIDGMFPSVFR